jgi:hypothetical protein
MNTDISEYLASGRSIREAPPGIAYGAGRVRLKKVFVGDTLKLEEPELRPLKAPVSLVPSLV